MTHGRKTVRVKARTGRERKPSKWVQWLYPELLSKFSRLRKLGLQFDSQLLRQVAIQVLKESKADFMEKIRDDSDRDKQVSTEKTQAIREKVTKHLGVLRRGFVDGEFDEDTIDNVDETHFSVDFDTGKTLGFVGETSIKYADVVSRGEGMTMVVRITGATILIRNRKLKAIWCRKWNAKKLELIKNSSWQATARKDGSWSDKLKNPGKRFFLQLAAECVQELNAKRDKNGLTFARKAKKDKNKATEVVV
ncbi:TPA: hypothetical protein N0F65_003919 [Lagenidium giganteum]|uniref:Uncharacterized protein n=1 Tax=Lagenidium giganteum TaxID=4803 RepID=A0AAV2ZCK2_9STRA|nr:TPA: hypothetical protein N0F65_003919 [Lagenidium giganteum]